MEVFSHENADAEVDAEDVGIVPVGLRMEGVAEAVASPGAVAVVGFESTLNTQAIGGKEGKRASGCVGNDGAVDIAKAVAVVAGTSPGGVAVLRVGGADAPVVE
jgi:hypothetical protein